MLKAKSFGQNYYCPVCHYSFGVKADDLFLKALVSEKYLGETLYVEQILEEHEVLKPFKAFLDLPCEVCRKPVKEWDEYNVKRAVKSIGVAHTSCWQSELGQSIEFKKSIEKFKKDMKVKE